MDRDPEEIKTDIEETRSRMGDTVEALSYKTDVRARARDAVTERIDTIKGKVSDVVETAGGKMSDVASSAREQMPSTEQARQGLQTVRWLAEDNALGLAMGAAAIGFLLGLCLPVSRVERERVGPLGEQMAESAKTAATNAVEQGKAAVTQAIGDAITGATGESSRSGSQTGPEPS
jgi:methyl-accepting chemotaxis protein